VVLAGLLLASGQAVLSQPAQPVGPPRVSARKLFNDGKQFYKNNDYELAAQRFAEVLPLKIQLTPNERKDLDDYIQKNNVAMKGRRDGGSKLTQAVLFIQQNRLAEAENLIREAQANHYTDKKQLEQVNQALLDKKRPAPMLGNPKAVLAEGRNTYKRAMAQLNQPHPDQAQYHRDLDRAMSLALQAKNDPKAKWSPFPWSDNPDKLLKDIEKAYTLTVTSPKETFFDKLFHHKPAPPPGPDKNAVGPNGKNGANDGPVLIPANDPGKDKTGKTGEAKSPLQAVKNFFTGGPPKDKNQDKDKNPPAAKTTSQAKEVKAPVQVVSNTAPISPPPPSAAPLRSPADAKTNAAQARQLIQNGYQALQAKDYASARRCATQAKELRPDLEWFEQNPDRLLADIQKREPGGAAVVVPPIIPAKGAEPAATAKFSTLAEKEEQAKAKAHELVAQGRQLYKKNQLDEADKICAQAAGVPGVTWRLFEDNPEKLRIDIQKARSRHDREESARLLTEARALFKNGKVAEAKSKAWQAQKLHGPYNAWDLGDRPQKLLAEIDKAESKQSEDATAKTGPESRITPKDGNNQVAQNTKDIAPWLPIPFHKTETAKAPVQSEAKVKARALLVQARGLMQQGQLIPAREKALAAQNMNGVFTAQEDSPAAVYQDLGQMCIAYINGYVKHAEDGVRAGADPAFQKADADFAAARALAVAFQLDAKGIDDRQAMLKQAALGGPANPPAPVQTALSPLNQAGKDKLDMARLELKAGNIAGARRIAVEAFDQKYGVQKEAAEVMRLIDGEEYNQFVLTAIKTMESGMDAFRRHDYAQARSILAGVDPRLLDEARKATLRNVLTLREMQPVPSRSGKAIASGLQQISAPGVAVANEPGKARAEDRPGGEDPFNSVRAMEDVLFQKLYEESRKAQSQAMAQVKAGDTAQAMDTLKEYLGQLDRTQLDPDKVGLIKKQIEKRMQDYRTIQAQTNLAKAATNLNEGHWDEGKQRRKILKTQEQVVELMDQYRSLMKEGKYKDALLAARKAGELDPDNLAVTVAVREATMLQRLKYNDKIRDENEYRVWKELEPDEGAYVNPSNPMAFDKDRMKIIDRMRKGLAQGIPSVNHNSIERDIERKLQRIIPGVNFQQTPLSTVLRDLSALSGINIVSDKAALTEANIGLDQPLSLSVENISMKSVLKLLLQQVNLTYVIKDEVLQITTESWAKGQRNRIVYQVGDLVVPPKIDPEHPLWDLEKVLAGHMANATQVMNGGSPMQGPFGLTGGAPIGSSTGFGNPPGTRPGGQDDYIRRAGTQEKVLIELITNTIAPETWEGQGGPGKIQYFPLAMSLVIAQTQDVQEQVQELLAALRRLMDLEVAIEMKLVSVSEAFFEKIGVNFSMNIPTHNSQSIQNQLLNGSFQPPGLINTPFPPSLHGLVSGLTAAQTLTPDLGVPIKATSYAFSNPPFGGFPGTLDGDGGLQLGLAFLSDIQVAMFMEAAQGDRRTNIMQAPKITVFNGSTASISVNTSQFFLTSINLATSPFGQLIASPVQQPFSLGVFLTVTPVVSADRRFVRLNMTPSMTNLVDATVPLIPIQFPVPSTFFGPGAGTTTGQPESIFTLFFQQPSFSTITLNTTVNVPDGGTVLLGGLKTLSEGRNEFGPPILSKIPYLSRLFKNVAYGREAQSLMIMVTPRIIINEEEERIFRGIEEPIPRP
jgi:type II secretory pathway component GspD/PulD (secretin)